MPASVSGGPVPEDEIMKVRGMELNAMVHRLLNEGTVADLFTVEGAILRKMFTPSEEERSRHLPMGECKGFDGRTCDYCRGASRFANCNVCQGYGVQEWIGPEGLALVDAEIENRARAAREMHNDGRPSLAQRFWKVWEAITGK